MADSHPYKAERDGDRCLPTVDVLVSAYNEAAHIRRCLEHVLGQDYPRERLAVWFVDGGSTDETVAIAREIARHDQRLHVVESTARRNLPDALNLGLAQSSGEIVAKVDAHGYPEQDYLRLAVEALLEDDTLACAGGRPIQHGDRPFGDAVALARGSRVGVGGSEYGRATERAYVSTVQCGVYRRAAVEVVGAFDATMNFGEDDELNWRLVKAGYRILLDTRLRFHYVTRSTWPSAYRQYRNYGQARVGVVRKHPDYLRVYHLAPAAFLLSVIALGVLSMVSAASRWALLIVLGSYLAALSLEAARVAGRSVPRIVGVFCAFVALHLGYGMGMVRGTVRWMLELDGRRVRRA